MNDLIIIAIFIGQYLLFMILSFILMAYLDLTKYYPKSVLLYNAMIPGINIINFLMIVYVIISVKFSRKFDELMNKFF